MADRPGITFSIYTSCDIRRDVEAIALKERRSISSMVSLLLEQAITDWQRRHAGDNLLEGKCIAD